MKACCILEPVRDNINEALLNLGHGYGANSYGCPLIENSVSNKLKLLAIDRDHLNLEQQPTIGRNAPVGETPLAVALIGGNVELPDLSNLHSQAALPHTRQSELLGRTLPQPESPAFSSVT